MMDQSKIGWAEVTGGARAKEAAINAIQANKNAVGTNRVRTEPVLNKLKAANLVGLLP